MASAAAIHALIDTGSDMVLAMLAGLALGLLAHLLVLAIAGPLVGFFQVMAPGGVIGMYGGALFAMRDSMGMEDRAAPTVLALRGSIWKRSECSIRSLSIVGGPTPPRSRRRICWMFCIHSK